MKTAIAIALIVCGTVLVLSPAIYDFLMIRHLTVELNGVRDDERFQWGSRQFLSLGYRYVCWLFGVAMIGVAVLQSVRLPGNASASAMLTQG
jgi:hypothetical protein